MRRFFLMTLILMSPAFAEPQLSPQQREKLKGAKQEVYAPAYVPRGYKLVSTLVDKDGSYSLQYGQSGKPYGFSIYTINYKLNDDREADETVPVSHPTLGKSKLCHVPTKFRGGRWMLRPAFKSVYLYEGDLPKTEAVKMLQSLEKVQP